MFKNQNDGATLTKRSDRKQLTFVLCMSLHTFFIDSRPNDNNTFYPTFDNRAIGRNWR